MLIKSTLIGVGIRKEYRIILRIYFAFFLFFIFWHSMDFQVFFSWVFHISFVVVLLFSSSYVVFVSFQIKAFSAHYWRRFFGSLSITIIFIFDCRDSIFVFVLFLCIQSFCFSLFFGTIYNCIERTKRQKDREILLMFAFHINTILYMLLNEKEEAVSQYINILVLYSTFGTFFAHATLLLLLYFFCFIY